MRTNACDWKLYVHFGTWKYIDALGMYYILCELDMYVFILFSHGEIQHLLNELIMAKIYLTFTNN